MIPNTIENCFNTTRFASVPLVTMFGPECKRKHKSGFFTTDCNLGYARFSTRREVHKSSSYIQVRLRTPSSHGSDLGRLKSRNRRRSESLVLGFLEYVINTQSYISINFLATNQFVISGLAMATNTAPTVKLSVGNSSKRSPLPSSVCINLVSAFSKSARRLIAAAAAAAGTQQHQIKLEFPSSDYWPPDAGGLYFVFEWLTRTQIQDGVLQFKQITKEVIQANQMPLTGLRFDQLLRIHEALLILEADNILAYQYKAVRGGIMNIVLNNVLRPADFAMLVRIFRAPPTLDMALVDVAISKAWQQLASGQMPFVTGCAAYRTIIQSQIPSPELYDFRKSIVSHIDTKLTLHDFCASLDFLCKADPTLGNHAVRTLVLKEVKDSAESIEIDKHAAVNPKLVMAICLIRFERDNKIQVRFDPCYPFPLLGSVCHFQHGIEIDGPLAMIGKKLPEFHRHRFRS